MSEDNDTLRTLVAEVAAAYFSNSHVSVSDIPQVVGQIAASLQSVGGQAAPAAEAPAEDPAVAKPTAGQIRKSITPDALISFEDGRAYKALKRHLNVRGLTPQDYRAKHGLPHDYPMVAPAYSAQRSALAKSLGLGRKAGTPAPAAAKRGRKPAQG